MKINKKTQDLLNKFEFASISLELEEQLCDGEDLLYKMQTNYKNAKKELHRHLFKLEQRIRLYKREKL